MKAVIYARYSSDNQREESIEGQIRDCRAYAEYNGIEIVGEYIDRAFSAKTDDRPDFQRMIADSSPISRKILAVYEQGKEVPRRDGKALQVGRQKNFPLQHVRILRDGGRKGIVYADKLAKVVSNGQPEISARLTKAHIRLPERRAQCQESKRDDDGNGNIKTFAHNTPPQFPHRKAIGYKCSTSSRRQVPMLSREELRGSS